jgi:hypothetical protein
MSALLTNTWLKPNQRVWVLAVAKTTTAASVRATYRWNRFTQSVACARTRCTDQPCAPESCHG